MNVPPERATSSQAGTVPAIRIWDELPAWVPLHCTAIPFPGVMKAAKYGEPGSFVARIITPALAHAFVFVCESMRTLIVPSAARGWLSSRKASYVPQMSLPPAWIVRFEPVVYCEPAAGVGKPMSWQVQPVGQRLGGCDAEPAIVTVSRVSAASVVPFELTASPATIAPPDPIVTFEPTIEVQVIPSVEVNAVNVF